MYFQNFSCEKKGLFWISVTVDWIGPDDHGFCPFEAARKPRDMSQDYVEVSQRNDVEGSNTNIFVQFNYRHTSG